MDATKAPDPEARRARLAGLLAAGDLDTVLGAGPGDSVVLADIAYALRLLAEQPQPDLGAALRLAFARDAILRRTRTIPAELPVAWARLGEPDRAAAIARTLRHPPGVLISLAGIAFAAGDTARGLRLADEVEEVARDVHTLCALATVLAGAGELARARRLVVEAQAGLSGTDSPAVVIKAHIAVGRPDRAEALLRTHGHSLDAVAALAGVEADPERRRGLIDEVVAKLRTSWDLRHVLAIFEVLAKSMIDTGEGDRLVGLAMEIADHEYADQRADRLEGLANALAGAGDLNGARRLLDEARTVRRGIADSEYMINQEAWGVDPEPGEWWYELMVRLGEPAGREPGKAYAAALVRLGDLEQAEAVVGRSYDAGWRAAALATLASRAAGAGDPDRGRRLAAESAALAHTTGSPAYATPDLIALARALAEAGEPELAEAAARAIREPVGRLKTLAALSGRSARAGDLDRARRLVREVLDQIRSITGPRWAWDQWDVWTASVDACADLGDPGLAEAAGGVFSSTSERDSVRARLAEAWIRAGDPERAESTARRIAAPHRRSRPLALVARAWIEAGDQARAERIARGLPDAPADLPVSVAPPSNGESTATADDPRLADAGDPERVRRQVAAALADRPADQFLPVLAKVDPAAVIAVAAGHFGIRRPDR